MICIKDQNKTHVNDLCSLFDPADVQTASDEGVRVSHLLDDLAGGLASTVA